MSPHFFMLIAYTVLYIGFPFQLPDHPQLVVGHYSTQLRKGNHVIGSYYHERDVGPEILGSLHWWTSSFTNNSLTATLIRP